MNEAQLYQDLLALPGLHVTAVETAQGHTLIHGQIEPEATACPVCDELTALVNQYDTRKPQDLSIAGKQVYLYLRIPQHLLSENLISLPPVFP